MICSHFLVSLENYVLDLFNITNIPNSIYWHRDSINWLNSNEWRLEFLCREKKWNLIRHYML